MTLSNPLPSILKLADSRGFEVKLESAIVRHFWHPIRVEGFTLIVNEDGSFHSAIWRGRLKWAAIVDRRSPGERSKRSGESLVGDSKRRPVGVEDVRPALVSSPDGVHVGYMQLKHRIKDPEWVKGWKQP